MSCETTVSIIRQVTLIICEMRERGIEHCDLRPSNIMYEARRDRVTIIDFDSARIQEKGNDCDSGRGDIHSLGILVFELLDRLPEQDRHQ